MKKPRQSWLTWIVLVLGTWALVAYFHDIQQVTHTVLKLRWQFIGLAIAIQLLSYLVYASVYQAAFQTVSIKSKLPQLFVIYLESLLSSIVIPGGTIAFFLRFVKRTEQSSSRGAVALFFVRVADLVSFCCLFALGIIYLALTERLERFEIISAFIVFLITLIVIYGLIAAAYRSHWLERLLHLIAKPLNWLWQHIKKKDLVSIDRLSGISDQFGQGARETLNNTSASTRTLLLAFTSHLLDLLTVLVLFMSFHATPSFGVLLSGFVIGLLFSIIPITPQGVGTVEGAMILAYSHLGVKLGLATLITIAFRGLSFWLPAIIGFFLLQKRVLVQTIENAKTN